MFTEAREVSKTLGGRLALDHVTAVFPEGSATGLLGPNGAGKTTLIRLLTGVLTPTAGECLVDNSPVTRTTAARFRQRMGVQADGNLYEDLTLEDNLITWARLFGASAEAAATRCREVIDQFGIGDRAKDPVGALSKGLRQRALIARAVLHRPEMLFLDEPMTGLDPEAADDLLRYLIDLRAESQCSLVVCTHQLRGIGQLCDRVVILDQGQVAESGGIADLVRTGWDSTPVHLRLSGRADDISAALLSSAAVGAADERGGGVWEIALKDETKLPELVCRLIQSGIDVWEVTPTVRTVRDLYFRALKGTEA